jgi:hypothetical protein
MGRNRQALINGELYNILVSLFILISTFLRRPWRYAGRGRRYILVFCGLA